MEIWSGILMPMAMSGKRILVPMNKGWPGKEPCHETIDAYEERCIN